MNDNTITPENTAVLEAGSVTHSLDEAAVSIHDLIALLEELRDDEGAEFIVLPSGNYRGAKWQALRADGYSWAADE